MIKMINTLIIGAHRCNHDSCVLEETITTSNGVRLFYCCCYGDLCNFVKLIYPSIGNSSTISPSMTPISSQLVDTFSSTDLFIFSTNTALENSKLICLSLTHALRVVTLWLVTPPPLRESFSLETHTHTHTLMFIRYCSNFIYLFFGCGLIEGIEVSFVHVPIT